VAGDGPNTAAHGRDAAPDIRFACAGAAAAAHGHGPLSDAQLPSSPRRGGPRLESVMASIQSPRWQHLRPFDGNSSSALFTYVPTPPHSRGGHRCSIVAKNARWRLRRAAMMEPGRAVGECSGLSCCQSLAGAGQGGRRPYLAGVHLSDNTRIHSAVSQSLILGGTPHGLSRVLGAPGARAALLCIVIIGGPKEAAASFGGPRE
jgi:hypothetical protein